MAPMRKPKLADGAAAKKPAVLGPATQARHASRKYSPPQRSSLRRAIQESLLELPGVPANSDPLPSTPLPFSSTTKSRTICPQRSSLRRALQASRQDLPTIITASAAVVARPLPSSPQRSSLRQALRESKRDLSITTSIGTPFPTLSTTSSLSLSQSAKPTLSPPSSLASTLTILTTPPSSTPPPGSTTTSLSPGTPSTSASTTPWMRNRSKSAQQDYRGLKGSQIGPPKGNNGSRNKNNAVVAAGKSKVDNNSIASRKGWYRVRCIIAEARNPDGRTVYLVDWEGCDPRTGTGWPGSWVNARDVSTAAIRDWQERLKQIQNTRAAAA
ncbi:hypothetical protein F4677DRAFT_394952 [Hypoxylon crocopeplum]|nr:hypothetical protein F4677DRAFT_394952 [Hypoxylon crocopeplum]